MNILLLTSRPEAAERLRLQFTEVDWTLYALGITDYTVFDAVLIVESIACNFFDENLAPLGGAYISVFKAWKHYLAEVAPEVKLLVAGFNDAQHPNYLPLHTLPGNFDLKAKIDKACPNYESWQTEAPLAGEDVLARLNLFYEGHHRDGIVMNMAKVRQCLNHAYYNPHLAEAEVFRELWSQTLYPEISSARGLKARWVNYEPYFRLLPFYLQLQDTGINDFMAELNKIFSGPQHLSEKQLLQKQQAFIQFDGFNRLDRIQLALDHILRCYVSPEIIGAMLIIDDDRRFHEEIKADFPDFKISHVYTAQEITDALANSYDIVLLDLQLDPMSDELTGLNYINAIKKARPEAALIVVTTHTKNAVVQEALKNGADYCLRKQDFDLREWHNLFLRAAAGKLMAANMPADLAQPITESAKILIITPNDDTFHKAQALQHQQTYEFTRALTPQQAIDIIHENSDYFELVLLDWPDENHAQTTGGGLNNPELLIQVRVLLPETPIIVILNESNTEKMAYAIDKGANDCLEKDRYEPKIWQTRYNLYIELKRLRGVVNKFTLS